MLVTYSALTKSLLAPPPPPYSELAPDWQRHVEWLTILSQNLMAAANDLRPVQARVNLESMMRRQLDLRREETSALHAKCDALEARLAELRGEVRASRTGDAPEDETPTIGDGAAALADVTPDDVLRWAEEIG
jgi:mediator of RNA polymerase II transcription subunit 7